MTKQFIGINDYEFEERVTNSATGGQKGKKLARFGLIPAQALLALARHYGIGAIKYDDNNWRLGYDWDLSIDALDRHFNAWKRGESIYEEKFEKDGTSYTVETHHLIAVAWQAFTLYIFEKCKLGKDTRPSTDSDQSQKPVGSFPWDGKANQANVPEVLTQAEFWSLSSSEPHT